MYRQVLIEPQQHLQRIVWRESSDTELSHFQLNTITYGKASASFLATRCLKQISLDKRSEYPIESEIIEKDCYVDDVITGSASSEGYFCIFICLSTKAVHVELATELTTQAFIAAFKRFVARRGVCESLFSDNGSNFVGANNEFNAINNVLRDSKFQRFLETTNMKWHFIPSRSPHFGGVWEAAVKSFKQHLKRVVNNNPLTYEELYTLVVRIEAVLNSRSLVQMSNDPHDFDSLTPGHFLIGRPLNALPESDLREVPVNRS
ncbi:uncharacterized protein LOC126735665 [Anthonomus grandis grandis]|uniref:uncharacterized protein LOC126735665 n=1 Tax=Anthonomus grandis grandis TaxID=2921223 RepID=UPI0021651F20|nr:uncharacterized protein LOC126735665 [Anthonomus grandis grandis]